MEQECSEGRTKLERVTIAGCTLIPMDLPGSGERVLRFFALVVVGYVLALLLLRLFESHFLFFPNYPDRLAGNWSPRGLLNQDAWFQASDGTKLHAWWIPAEGAVFTFLAFHGNAGNISDRAEVYKFLKQTPANVLAVEYRGYGKSEGVPSESGLYLDAEAALNYLEVSKGISAAKTIAYGQSLGTAVAAHLASKHALGGVILEAPFPSAGTVARQKLWFFPGLPLLLWGQLDTEKALQSVQAPILIVHCLDDPVIPFELGKAVYTKAHEPKFFLSIHGQCHEEASLVSPKAYQEQILIFLSTISRTTAPPQN
jgi:fermentation-respiration switch protein FrsA (DUF1100 family)